MTDWTALEQAAQTVVDEPDGFGNDERFQEQATPCTILALLAELREAQAEAKGRARAYYEKSHECEDLAEVSMLAKAEAARLREQVQAAEQKAHDAMAILLEAASEKVQALQGELAEVKARKLEASAAGLRSLLRTTQGERDAARAENETLKGIVKALTGKD